MSGHDPAFPRAASSLMGGVKAQTGMTLRQYYAGQALVGLITQQEGEGRFLYNDLVKEAWRIADALLYWENQPDA